MKKTAHISGFSLVELALAMLVVSIGLVALIGVFVSGMSASQAAERETQAAFFAKTVFSAVTVELQNQWQENLTGRPFELGSRWVAGSEDGVGAPGSGFVQFSSSRDELNRVGYSGQITGPGVAQPVDQVNWFNYALTEELPLPGVTQLKGIRLEVWPGEFASSVTTGVVFYTEIYRMN